MPPIPGCTEKLLSNLDLCTLPVCVVNQQIKGRTNNNQAAAQRRKGTKRDANKPGPSQEKAGSGGHHTGSNCIAEGNQVPYLRAIKMMAECFMHYTHSFLAMCLFLCVTVQLCVCVLRVFVV